MNLADIHEHVAKTRLDVVTMWQDEQGNIKWEESLPNQTQIAELVSSYTAILNEVPKSVTNQQLKQALIRKSFGENKPSLHPDAIESFLKSLPEPTKSLSLNYWSQSNEMLRDNQMLSQLSPMLGLTSEDLDSIWIYAKNLP